MIVRRIVLIGLMISAAGAVAETAAEYNAQGVEHYNAKEWAAAIEAFGKAYELASDNATVRHNLCNAYQSAANDLIKAMDFDGAAELLEHAIRIAPENPSPLLQLAGCYLRLDMISDAVFRIEEALEIAPDNVAAHDYLGDAYYKANDLRAALKEWEWVQKADPGRPGLKEKLEKAQREQTVERNYLKTRRRHFEASFAPGTTHRDLSKVLQILDQAYMDIGYQFGRVYPPNTILVVVYTAEDFSEATQLSEHVGAVYDGKIRVPLEDKSGQVIDDAELERRLRHEYVHVVVRHIANDNVPWWLNEGLAETFSRDLTEQHKAYLRKARDDGALLPLRQLAQTQLGKLSPSALGLAYCQAHATVHWLRERYGQRTLNLLLSSLAEGVEAEEALRFRYRRTYEMLDKELAKSLEK
ncbi:MAG TPA: hypothetical protein HPP77_06875 [Candidatus Hydrogenedentes bacterium]|nr:hypothetical protein [Candidatus Hydrogenedentota bacterium]